MTRLSAIVRLGDQALTERDLDRLFKRALEILAEALPAPRGLVLEPLRGSDVFVVRSALGWPHDVSGAPLGGSYAGLFRNALESGRAVDLSGSIANVSMLQGDPVSTGVVAPLGGPGGPLGVLAMFGTSPTPFDDDALQTLQAAANALSAAVVRRDTEEGLIQSQQRLQTVQKMEAIGRLAGGIAHDFNNLVQAIGGFTEVLLAQLPAADPLRHHVEEIRRAGGRAAALTRQLLAFSRQQVLQPRTIAMNEVVCGVEKLLRRLIGVDIRLETRLADDLGPVKADVAQLEQVLMNLAVNAHDAMPEGGALTITTRNVMLPAPDQRETFIRPGPYVLLEVVDTGHGMDAETRRRAFEPFFTTKPPGHGTGLGLSTVYGIVKQSGGYVLLDSEEGRGTRFRVYLPRVEGMPEPMAEAHQAESASAAHGGRTLLLVEDEDSVRDLFSEWLSAKGYQVIAASTAHEAIARSAAYEGTIDVLVADVVMPGMTGPALASRLVADRPSLKVIFMSGYADEAIGDARLVHPRAVFMQKPFALDTLLDRIGEVLGAASPGRPFSD